MQDVASLNLVALRLLFDDHIDRATVRIQRVPRATAQVVTALRRDSRRVQLIKVKRTVILVDLFGRFLAERQVLLALSQVLVLQVQLEHYEVEQLHLE